MKPLAHQCLKCGRSYPDGSPQILKGCEGCKGTRFFYTQKPIGEEEREELAARAQDELGRTGEGGRPRERRIPTKGDLPLGDDKDWVSMGPGNLRTIVEDVVRRAHEKKPTFRVGASEGAQEGEEAPPLAEWVRRRQQEIAGEESRQDDSGSSSGSGAGLDDRPGEWPPWPETRGKAPDPNPAPSRADEDPVPEGGEEGVVYRRSNRVPGPLTLEGETEVAAGDPDPGPGPGPEMEPATSESERDRSLPEGPAQAPRESADASGSSPLYPEGERPETVEVLEQGVYDLDVQRLLEKNPIVVHRDGKYSLHLPSLMEALGKKRR